MYPDTDQMGTMHHSAYVKYYETARWELFRDIGIPYCLVEDAGYLLPVTRMNFRFLKTTHYDELLTVKTTLMRMRGVRIWFNYRMYNQQNELINEAETELAFVSRETWKPCPMPEFIYKTIHQKSQKCLINA